MKKNAVKTFQQFANCVKITEIPFSTMIRLDQPLKIQCKPKASMTLNLVGYSNVTVMVSYVPLPDEQI